MSSGIISSFSSSCSPCGAVELSGATSAVAETSETILLGARMSDSKSLPRWSRSNSATSPPRSSTLPASFSCITHPLLRSFDALRTHCVALVATIAPSFTALPSSVVSARVVFPSTCKLPPLAAFSTTSVLSRGDAASTARSYTCVGIRCTSAPLSTSHFIPSGFASTLSSPIIHSTALALFSSPCCVGRVGGRCACRRACPCG